MSPKPDDPLGLDQSTIRSSPGDQETEVLPPPGSAVDSMGGWMPSRPASIPAGPAPADPLSIAAGGRIGEFVVERTLGRGGFGVVYLARQQSLDRQVALKVVSKQGGADGGEGRSLARLEHDNIVQVYGEAAEPVTGARLLWMQYVAGTTLATIARELGKINAGAWTGADLLAVLDGLGLPPAMFDPAAMKDRDFLASADHVEAVCRIGEQLARALEHAHDRGVLHRDVKPANVLVSRYGRPLLADFNLATRDAGEDGTSVFGGTLAYMAPEHLDAFNSNVPTVHEAVDARSDLYALCVVLWELSSGGHPYPSSTGAVDRDDLPNVLARLAARRREQPPEHAPIDHRLKAALARGLSADPAKRYATAGDLAETVAGLREQRTAVRAFPAADATARWAWRHPVPALVLACVLPQFVGSVLQISYNYIRILSSLDVPQREFFEKILVPAYNLIAYPICLGWLATRFVRVLRVWGPLRRGERVSDDEADEARVRMLALPLDTAIASTAGWLPGMVLFPLMLHCWVEPLPGSTWGHFVVSFLLAWMIAATYSFFLGTGVAVRTMYIRFWTDPRDFRERAARELADVPDRLRAVNLLAGLIPSSAAVLLLMTSDGVAFRSLIVTMIVAGIVGFALVGRLSRRYLQVIDACTGGARQAMRRAKRAVQVTESPTVESSFSPGGSTDRTMR